MAQRPASTVIYAPIQTLRLDGFAGFTYNANSRLNRRLLEKYAHD